MTLPVMLTSSMPGAPSLTKVNGSINTLFLACLVNGFNSKTVVSATASSGVVAYTLPSGHGFTAKDPVAIAGATPTTANGTFRVQSIAGNVVSVAVPGIADGALTGTITMKFAPLGWTRPYAGTNLGAYRQGGTPTHKRYLRIYDGTIATESGRYYARAYEAMTAISTGTGPFPTTAEVAGNGVEHIAPVAATGNRPWIFVGTPRSFYFLCGHATDYSFNTPPVWRSPDPAHDAGMLFFGDYDRIQRPGDVYAQGLSANLYFPSSGIYGSRAHTQALGSRPTHAFVSPVNFGYFGAGRSFPDMISGGMNVFGPPYIEEYFGGAYGIRGFMPGVLTLFNGPICQGNVAYTLGTIVEDIVGVTGRSVMMAGHLLQGGEFLLKLDEDWGDS